MIHQLLERQEMEARRVNQERLDREARVAAREMEEALFPSPPLPPWQQRPREFTEVQLGQVSGPPLPQAPVPPAAPPMFFGTGTGLSLMGMECAAQSPGFTQGGSLVRPFTSPATTTGGWTWSDVEDLARAATLDPLNSKLRRTPAPLTTSLAKIFSC